MDSDANSEFQNSEGAEHIVDLVREDIARVKLRKFSNAIDLIRRVVGKEATVQLLASFLYIADNDGCYMQDLEESLGTTGASNSRNTDWLAAGRRGTSYNGLNFITKEMSYDDRRRMILKLTKKGKDFFRQLEETLD